MSRTWDFLSVKKPNTFPFTKTIMCETSVISISSHGKLEKNGFLRFVIGPTFLGVPIVKRKLTLSESPKPDLDFSYIEAGKVKLDDKEIHIFLEER